MLQVVIAMIAVSSHVAVGERCELPSLEIDESNQCTFELIKALLPDISDITGTLCLDSGLSVQSAQFVDFPGVGTLVGKLGDKLNDILANSPIESKKGEEAVEDSECRGLSGLYPKQLYCLIKFNGADLPSGLPQALKAVVPSFKGCLAITPQLEPTFALALTNVDVKVGKTFGLGLTGVMASLNGCLTAKYQVPDSVTSRIHSHSMRVHAGVGGSINFGLHVGVSMLTVEAAMQASINLDPDGDGNFASPAAVINDLLSLTRAPRPVYFEFLFKAKIKVGLTLGFFDFGETPLQGQVYVSNKKSSGLSMHVGIFKDINDLGDVFGEKYKEHFQDKGFDVPTEVLPGFTPLPSFPENGEAAICLILKEFAKIPGTKNPFCKHEFGHWGMLGLYASYDNSGFRLVIQFGSDSDTMSFGKNESGYFFNFKGVRMDGGTKGHCFFDDDCPKGQTCFNSPGMCPGQLSQIDFKCHDVMAACMCYYPTKLWYYLHIGKKRANDVPTKGLTYDLDSRSSVPKKIGTCSATPNPPSTCPRLVPPAFGWGTIDILTQACALKYCRQPDQGFDYQCMKVPESHVRRLSTSAHNRSRFLPQAGHMDADGTMLRANGNRADKLLPRSLDSLEQRSDAAEPSNRSRIVRRFLHGRSLAQCISTYDPTSVGTPGLSAPEQLLDRFGKPVEVRDGLPLSLLAPPSQEESTSGGTGGGTAGGGNPQATPQRIEVRTASTSEEINGIYDLQSETYYDMPVWQAKANQDLWLLNFAGKGWYVTPSDRKRIGESDSGGWARSRGEATLPTTATNWQNWDGQEWVSSQMSISVLQATVSTTLTENVAAGTDTLRLADVSGLSAGMSLMISGDGHTEEKTIVSVHPDPSRRLSSRRLGVAGGVTLDSPLQYAYTPGAVIEGSTSGGTGDGTLGGGNAQVCQDHNEHCASWAGTGECDTNAVYMHMDCSFSCGMCKVCSCPNGVARIAPACTTDGAIECSSCNPGYLHNGLTCQALGCTTGSGTGCKTCVAQAQRTSDTTCATCNAGYHEDTQTCQAHGCKSPCASCVAEALRDHHAHCATCVNGYYLSGDTCQAYGCAKPCYQCAPQEQRTSDTTCSACNAGYVLSGTTCQAHPDWIAEWERLEPGSKVTIIAGFDLMNDLCEEVGIIWSERTRHMIGNTYEVVQNFRPDRYVVYDPVSARTRFQAGRIYVPYKALALVYKATTTTTTLACNTDQYQVGLVVVNCEGGHGSWSGDLEEGTEETLVRIPANTNGAEISMHADEEFDLKLFDGDSCILGHGCTYSLVGTQVYGGFSMYFSGDNPITHPATETITITGKTDKELEFRVKAIKSFRGVAAYRIGIVQPCSLPEQCAPCSSSSACPSGLSPACDGTAMVTCQATTTTTPQAQAVATIVAQAGTASFIIMMDLPAFLANDQAKLAVTKGIAAAVGISPEWVSATFTPARRLIADNLRRLSFAVKVDFTINLPSAAGDQLRVLGNLHWPLQCITADSLMVAIGQTQMRNIGLLKVLSVTCTGPSTASVAAAATQPPPITTVGVANVANPCGTQPPPITTVGVANPCLPTTLAPLGKFEAKHKDGSHYSMGIKFVTAHAYIIGFSMVAFLAVGLLLVSRARHTTEECAKVEGYKSLQNTEVRLVEEVDVDASEAQME